MSNPIAFRFTNETIADMDVIATSVGCDRKEAVRLALADYRARVTGLVPASAIEPPPPPAVASGGPTDEVADDPEITEARQATPDATPRPPRREAPPRPTSGPIQSIRRVPIKLPELSRNHHGLNPVRRAIEEREQGS